MAVSGGLGSIARFAVDALVQSGRLGEFPLGTLVVNLGGSFLLGLLVGLGASHGTMLHRRDRDARLVYDVLHLDARDPPPGAGRRARRWPGSTWASASLAGLAAVALGRALGGLL